MAISDIITGQFVRISQTPASIGDRIVGRIIDYFALLIYIVSTSYLIRGSSFSNADFQTWFLPLVLYLPAAGYSFLCEAFNHGQTLGKYFMRMRVVNVDGSTPTIGSLLMRWILIPVDIYFYCLGMLFIVCSRKNQRLGDMAAGTMVIKNAEDSKMHISLDEFYYARRDYTPVYPEAQNLSLGQVDVIKKTLCVNDSYNEQQIDLLTKKVENYLNILPRDDNHVKFLTTLLHDYQYYAMELV